MSYDNWRKRLEIAQLHKTVALRRAAVAALKINFSQPGEADEGYYRKPITEKHPTNGQNTIVGWIPVAYFIYDGVLTGNIGDSDHNREMTAAEVVDEQLWSYVVSHPISYELYKAVVERGEPWPDLAPPIDAATAVERAIEDGRQLGEFVTLATREINRDDNKPPEMLPEIEHAEKIKAAIGAAIKKVTSEDDANLAAGSKNRIAELRLAADKAGKAIYQPLHAAYVAEREKWLPMVNLADAEEKRLNREILTFRESERKRLAAIAAKAAEEQRLQDEANARAADRAIASGEPEQPPVVEEIAQPPAPTPIVPTYGRRVVKEELKKFAVIVDPVEVFKWMMPNQELEELLQKLATAAIRTGNTVPGTTTREGLI